MQTRSLRNGDANRFIATLRSDDEVAVEATGNSAWFRRRVETNVARVVLVAPSLFEVIRRPAKKTDRNDARAPAFFLSGDMQPEAGQKSEVHARLYSLIGLSDQKVKNRVSLLNRIYALRVRNGIGIRKEKPAGRSVFESAVAGHEWYEDERLEIDVIRKQVENIPEDCRRLERKIASVAETRPGYGNVISIKDVRTLSAAVFPCATGNISRFGEPGSLAAYFRITPLVSHSSDSRRVGRITRRGNKIARTAFEQFALVAMRYSPYLKAFYEKFKARHRTGKAIIATAGKLLNGIFHALKNGWVFEDFTILKNTIT